MKVLAIFVLSMLTAYSQDHSQERLQPQERPQRNWNISVAFFVGAQVMDTVSSRGAIETNPILGRGEFGMRQMAIKGGIASGVILAERIIMRKHPDTRRFWTWVNYGTGAAITAVAVRNWNLPPYVPTAAVTPIAK
jgi:hypothetical protein